MRILFDKNVPAGVRGFLPNHEVRTFVEMHWPDQLENGELLTMAERAGFDVMVDSNRANPLTDAVRGRVAEVVAAKAQMHGDLVVVSGLRLGAEMMGAEVAIELDVPIAGSLDEYVELAVRLAAV